MFLCGVQKFSYPWMKPPEGEEKDRSIKGGQYYGTLFKVDEKDQQYLSSHFSHFSASRITHIAHIRSEAVSQRQARNEPDY